MPRSGKHIVATATRISAAGGRKAAKRCTDSRFAKPRIFIARGACCPDRGKLSACQKVPKGKRIVTFCGVQKVTQKARGVPPCDPGSKLYGKIFFVTFPAFVSTPVCGATRFFGCFEPVRKGCCSADARPMFFENGLLYCKLTGANVFKNGSCSLSWLRWEFEILVC